MTDVELGAIGGMPRTPRGARTLAFLVGLFLPVLTLQTGYVGTPTDLASRVAPVDVLVTLLLGLLLFRTPMARVPGAAWIYASALILALVPALLISPGPEREVWTVFVALVMAFGFYLAGLNLGTSPLLLRAFLAGATAGVLGETLVVYHDVMSSSPWFPDPMPGRARGTFKANGQLGAYGFSMAGTLLVLGSTTLRGGRRTLAVAAGFLAASYVFLASRRTGMLSVGLWAGFFLAFGVRFARRSFYRLFAGTLALAVLGLGAFWSVVSASFVGRRFGEAVDSMKGREGFVQNQVANCLATAEGWFPLGFGVGRGRLIDPRDGHEVHNGLLAVLVELGVLGLVGYVGMTLRPLFAGRLRGETAADGYRILLRSFLAASAVFVFHNTLYRDRTFLLFLGLATTLSATAADLDQRRDGHEPGHPQA